jgi:hypothetical protein
MRTSLPILGKIRFFFHCTGCRDEKSEKEIKKGKRRGISWNSLRTVAEKQEKVIIQNHDMVESVFTLAR